MSDQHRERIPRDVHEIAQLLEHERPEATALELDRIKLRAQAARRRPVLLGKGNGFMRSRVVSVLVVVGLLGGGTGAMAAAGGPSPFDVLSSDHGEGASRSQYCPPTSHNPGKPKKPGPARCGHFPGDDNEGDGDHHGNGGDPGDDNVGSDDQGHGKGHGQGNDAVVSQGSGPGNGGGHGNGNAGGHGKGGGKHK
jgi:hypothetical protein